MDARKFSDSYSIFINRIFKYQKFCFQICYACYLKDSRDGGRLIKKYEILEISKKYVNCSFIIR